MSFVNARVVTPGGLAPAIRFADRVLSTGDQPRDGDAVVDLDGAFVLPGLVNAHDHLELNHYGRLKGRDRYENATAWIADMQPRLTHDPAVRAGRAHPLGARLFVGALKNLLAGTTTVAHHNPLYRQIDRSFPVRVVRRYGWAHSFHLQSRASGANGEAGGDVRRRYRATPPDAPFLVHVAEGVDDAAGEEMARLEAVGALGPNTVIVHGVGLRERDRRDLARRGAAVVWCPGSNRFLFGRTADVRSLLDGPAGERPARVCLGTDSRLTGSADILDELRVAAASAPVTSRELLHMVTAGAADLLRVGDVGLLAPGARADLIVLRATESDPGAALLRARRRDLELVAIDGQPMIGAPGFVPVFQARSVPWRPIVVDDVSRLADAKLARTIARCPIREPGVECA